jgi:hypothetical protein
MEDYIFYFIIVPIILLYQYVIIWKRNQLEKIGYNYPIFNSSFRWLSDFKQRVKIDKNLKIKYKTLLYTIYIILAVYVVMILIILNLK